MEWKHKSINYSHERSG